MWTSTLELDPKRIVLTQLLGRFWPGAYFSFTAPLRVQNVPREALGASNWVRVRNRLAGICGSDLHLIYAKGDLRVAPAALPGHQSLYLGHEVVGEVIEVGDDVQHLRIGDRVALQYHQNCLSTGTLPLCHFCAAGNYNFCERGELQGPLPLGGGWSEEMLLPEQQLYRLPADLSDEQAVMLEPTAVALHAVLRRLPQAGERVLVIGAGTIGLLTVAVIRALAPQARVSVLARYPFQVEQATRLGAEHIIYPQDSYQGVQQATQAEAYRGWFGNQMLLGGFDVIYDTIGSRNTLHHALRWARAGSALVLVGIDLHLMHIDMTPLWYQEISLLGSLSHGLETWPPATSNQRSTFDIAADLIMQQRLSPEQLITHRFALTDYQHALMTAAGKSQNRAIKILFDYALLPASVVPNVRASRPRRLASMREQWSSLDAPESSEPSENEPPESDLAATPQQARQEKDFVEKVEEVEEDTEKVRAIKKVLTVPPEEFSWASRASEAISGNNHQGFSWALRASEAVSGDNLQKFSRPEEMPEEEHTTSKDFPESEIPITAAPYITEAIETEAIEIAALQQEELVGAHSVLAGAEEPLAEVEVVEPEEPIGEEGERVELEESSTEIMEQEEPVGEQSERITLETAIEATPELSEASTESMQPIAVAHIPTDSTTDEIAVSVPLQDEIAFDEVVVNEVVAADEVVAAEIATDEIVANQVTTAETVQDWQKEPVPLMNEEIPQTDEQILSNANEPAASSNGKARQGTRKKRATKEGSDTLEQVDATPVERKRSRPRARKKSQVE
jgi:threonine dehydrogenase-like Zn-dependent dehydrogenase